MTNDPSSLDNLQDIVMPGPVPLWPPAPGWLVLAGLLLLVLLLAAIRFLRQWKADAYRRAALLELAHARSPQAVNAILRRTALAFAPRETVASLRGTAWIEWLGERLALPPPESIQPILTDSLYQNTTGAPDLATLRDYASRWITLHKPPC